MNIVEFVVKVKDMGSAALKQFGASGTQAFTKVQESMDKLSGRSNTLKQSISDIDRKLAELTKTRSLSLDGSQVDRINKQMDTLQAKKDRLTGGSSGGLSSFFRTGMAIAGIGSLAFLGKDIMQAGIERQMNSTALQTLLGQNAGTRLNSQLLDFAKRSIYGNEVFNEGKLMAGSGIKANNIMPVLNIIGDIAMGDKERMKSLALAFSEASTRGSLTGINERMFLQGGLFNPLEQLHKMTGESLPALKKDMEKGKIGIDMLVKAMQYATGPMGRWHDMMQKMQETPAGKWTAFTGTMRTLAGTIGLELLPVLGALTDVLQGLIGNPDALYVTANAIGAMATAWGIYSVAANWAAIQTAALEALAYWPVAAAIAIGIAVVDIVGSNNTMVDSTGKAVTGMAVWADRLKVTWKDTYYVLETVFLGIASVFERLWNVINAGKDAKNPVQSVKALWHALTGDTDADKKLAKIKTAHQDWLYIHQAQNEGYTLMGKDGKPVKSGSSALTGLLNGGKYTPDGATGGASPAAATSAAISGGGVRNIYINVAKFQDKTEIHTMNLDHATPQVERILEDMFERVVNSAATALN